MMKHKHAVFFLAVALMTLPFSSSAQKRPGGKRPPTPVFVTPVVKTMFTDDIEALGTLLANDSVSLTPNVTELVTKVNFTDGQRVKKGDVLVQMNVDNQLALQAEQQSQIDEANRQMRRLEPLIKRGAASQVNLDAQRLLLATANARMKGVESEIRNRTIVAPFDGVTGLRNISVGTLAQPGTVITTIDDDSIMNLDFAVPEVFLQTLKKGAIVEASTRAIPNTVFTGKVAAVDSRIDPMTRSVIVRASLKNPDYALRPGLLMRVELQSNPRESLVVPEESLIGRGDKQFVMAVIEKDGKTVIQEKMVELGARRKGEAEIINGLTGGDRVVTHGTLRVNDGAEVVVKATETDNDSLQNMLKQSSSEEKE